MPINLVALFNPYPSPDRKRKAAPPARAAVGSGGATPGKPADAALALKAHAPHPTLGTIIDTYA